MADLAAAVVGSAVATAFGSSLRENCDALLAARNDFRAPCHFDAGGKALGIDPELDRGKGSRFFRLLAKLRDAMSCRIPAGTRLFLATTVGAVDLLERGDAGDSALAALREAERIFGLPGAVLVSAACASGQCAVGLAMKQLAAGRCRAALVVGADIASEFVTAGFTALGAVSPTVCRPYDVGRDGLTLGEAAAALLLAPSGETGFGRILRCAESCDAAHITAPDLTGGTLKRTIEAATAGGEIAGIVGHGTGTRYNDQAEVAALREIFPAGSPPLFSLKGNFGHTLGATGVLQTALGLEFAARRILPPQAGLSEAMEGAAAAPFARRLAAPRLLSLNIGFGGLNSAVVLEAS